MFSWSLLVVTATLQQGNTPAQPSGASRAVTAFVNVSVIPMDREQVLRGQTVVVQGDRIVAMGPAKQVSVPATAMRIDGRGKFLMPGLADMHMHVGFKVTDIKDAEQILFLLVANGVTTIRNMDYSGQSANSLGGEAVLQLRARVAAGKLWGPRIYTAGLWYADTSKSVFQNVEAYKAAGYDFIKVHDPSDTPLAKLDSLMEAAHRVGLPVAGHPVGGLTYALQHRFASIEHLEGAPGQEASERSLADTSKIPAMVAATREAGVRITPTRAIIEAFTAGDYDRRYYQRKQYVPATLRGIYQYEELFAADNSRRATQAQPTAEAAKANRERVEGAEVRRRVIMALQAAGVELLLGTDAPLLVPGHGVHQELDALVRAGLTPYQALVTGTRNVAAYFGTLDSTGTVGVGKRADLVLLAANPLTDIRHTDQIDGVMTAGRWASKSELQRQLDAFVAADAATPVAKD